IEPAVREALTACQRAAKRMKSLIEQLLLLARADAGKLIGERQLFDFSGMVEECLELLAPLAREKQLRVSTAITAVDFQGDPRLLGQVAINLITNAIAYNRIGGDLVVSLATSAEHLVLRVADTGLGISSEAQAQLFERFYRIDSARSRESGGAGLGLAIAQSIVRAHGGEITVHSEIGRGSTFSVVLPLNEQLPSGKSQPDC
ncbi:MAG TPA: HAMP domain-containing sensor histidine kinase, partial [Pirellulaceae bacterium]|nr:HAMP domain-containing sensor histidine kinase [Pirellulaceae bacterium]